MSRRAADTIRIVDDIEPRIEPETEAELWRVDERDPFRIGLLGNWSGQSQRKPIRSRRLVPIDRDNFDDVLRSMSIRVNTAAGEWVVRELDDFHPDALYTRLAGFAALRDLRARLSDPETFPEALRELTQPPEAAAPGCPAPKPKSAEDLLNEILNDSEAATAKPDEVTRAIDDLQGFAREAVRPYLVPRQDARAPELIRQTDAAASAAMRSVLRDPQFRHLEAAWRTLFLLVRRLETGEDLKIYLLDVTKEELEQDTSGLDELLTVRSGPWQILGANFSFGASDLSLLGRLGAVAEKDDAFLLAEADLSLLESPDEWEQFRNTSEAMWVGLALPRILLRLPYGEATSPCESFAFEEIDGKPGPEQMLYGNPGLFCAMLAGLSDELMEIEGLPVYSFQDDNESQALPCTEVELSESAAEALLEAGIMPVIAIRGTDKARLIRLKSVSKPAVTFHGRRSETWT